MTERDPDSNIADRYYKLGYALYRQRLLQQAIDILDVVKYDENIGDKANSIYDLATQLNEADGNVIAIPIESHTAGHWIVNAMINDKTVPLVIDTGAREELFIDFPCSALFHFVFVMHPLVIFLHGRSL